MKLGVAYNVFDGEELLEASIKSIRNCVAFLQVDATCDNFYQLCDYTQVTNHVENKQMVSPKLSSQTRAGTTKIHADLHRLRQSQRRECMQTAAQAHKNDC